MKPRELTAAHLGRKVRATSVDRVLEGRLSRFEHRLDRRDGRIAGGLDNWLFTTLTIGGLDASVDCDDDIEVL